MVLSIVLQMFYYYGWPLRPDRLLWLCVAAVAFGQFVHGKLRRPATGILEALMLCFAGLLIASVALSGGLNDGAYETSTRINEVFNLAIYPFITYVIASRLPFDPRRSTLIIRVLAWIGLYLGVTAVGERLGTPYLVWPRYILDETVGGHYGRIRGPFVDAVLMGLNETTCLIAVLICLHSTPSVFRRLLLLLSVPLLIAGIYLTNTRGPWIALALVLAIVSTMRTPVRKGAILCVGLILIGYFFAGASKFSIGQDTLFSRRQSTISDREVNYRVALAMGMDHPLFGVGLSQMDKHFMEYFQPEQYPEFGGWDGNHNEYLGLFAEAGFPALACYVVILAIVIVKAIACVRHAREESARLVGLLALCALLGLVVIGMFNEIRSAPFHICIAYFMAGVAGSAEHTAASRGPIVGPSDQKAAHSGSVGGRTSWMDNSCNA